MRTVGCIPYKNAPTGSWEITDKTSLSHKTIYFLRDINYFIDCSSVFEQNDMARKGVTVERNERTRHTVLIIEQIMLPKRAKWNEKYATERYRNIK